MAVAITATEQDVYPPRVLVSVTGLTLGDSIELFREVGGERAAVRAGSTDAVTDPSFLRVDAELPFGVPVSYLAIVNETDEYATATDTYTLDGDKPVITDAVSGLTAEAVILAWDEKRYQRQASVFRVGGRNVVVSDDWGQFEGTIEFFTEATSSRDNLMTVLTDATSGVVQLRQPGTKTYDGVDSYLSVVGAAERRYSQDGSDPRRIISVDVVETDAWARTLEARGFTYADLEAGYGGPVVLNANPYFETNASGWSVVGGSVARSTAQAHQGAASLLLTPDGVTAAPEARTDLLAVQASRAYRASAWMRCTSARSVNLNINWYTSGGSYISTSSTSTALAANTWTSVTGTFAAPATAAQARLCPGQMAGTPASSVLVYIDEATLEYVPSYKDLEADYPTYLALAQADLS